MQNTKCQKFTPEDLITQIYPFGSFEATQASTLRERILRAPFVWYSHLEGIHPSDLELIRKFHVDRLMEEYPEEDTCQAMPGGELAVMRLPVGVCLSSVTELIGELEAVLPETTGWKLASLQETPFFAEIQFGKTRFGEMERSALHLWCLGGLTLRKNSKIRVKTGVFHSALIPSVEYPLLSWSLSRTPAGKKQRGWKVEFQLSHWTNEFSREKKGGVPLLLVR